MPQKDEYQILCRNQEIRNAFFHYIATGMARMDAYAKTAQKYYLSEDRIREIVANRKV